MHTTTFPKNLSGIAQKGRFLHHFYKHVCIILLVAKKAMNRGSDIFPQVLDCPNRI